ncbi:MAG TPA: thioredoxin family protein, partial [Thermoanaerobaculia bacterium]
MTDSIQHPVVSHDEWLAARTAFLKREKEFTHFRDDLSRQRRELPWERVEKSYVFDTPNGKKTLSDVFAGRSQLVVYHFMFPPEWGAGCKHCSFWADNFNGVTVHLNHRDVTFVAISRAPVEKLGAFKKRMGWSFDWLSSGNTDFNYDFGASFTQESVDRGTAVYNYGIDPGFTDREGVSVFYKDQSGAIFHTYSCYARGIDMMNTAYHYLDVVPKGRDEDPKDTQSWVRHHDR